MILEPYTPTKLNHLAPENQKFVNPRFQTSAEKSAAAADADIAALKTGVRNLVAAAFDSSFDDEDTAEPENVRHTAPQGAEQVDSFEHAGTESADSTPEAA